jgi:hypothetical protein
VLRVARLVVLAALLPIPIGVGPRYHPPPGAHGACARAPLEAGARVHVELFARRRVIVVPAGIGSGARGFVSVARSPPAAARRSGRPTRPVSCDSADLQPWAGC